MIPDPGNHLKHYAKKLFPKEDAERMVIAEIGASAHVDMDVPSVKPGLKVRLMLPHTAPVEAIPLVTNVWLHGSEVWDYRKDPNGMLSGSQVHLHRDKLSGYVFLYLSPDERKKDRLDLAVPLDEVISPRAKYDDVGRWDLMDRLGRTMHFTVHLSTSKLDAVRRRRQSLKARQKAA